jgi:hypothetical protein
MVLFGKSGKFVKNNISQNIQFILRNNEIRFASISRNLPQNGISLEIATRGVMNVMNTDLTRSVFGINKFFVHQFLVHFFLVFSSPGILDSLVMNTLGSHSSSMVSSRGSRLRIRIIPLIFDRVRNSFCGLLQLHIERLVEKKSG